MIDDMEGPITHNRTDLQEVAIQELKELEKQIVLVQAQLLQIAKEKTHFGLQLEALTRKRDIITKLIENYKFTEGI